MFNPSLLLKFKGFVVLVGTNMQDFLETLQMAVKVNLYPILIVRCGTIKSLKTSF